MIHDSASHAAGKPVSISRTVLSGDTLNALLAVNGQGAPARRRSPHVVRARHRRPERGDGVERRLAAILGADVIGRYALKALGRDLIEAKVPSTTAASSS